MLAEAFWRRDDFQKAAAALNGVDVSSNKLLISQYPALNVAKLESFKGQTPYEVQGDGQVTRVKFLKTDPLPLVSVRVNGGDEVTFFIDTGGSEVALDTEFAQGAWPAAVRRGARHFFRRPERQGPANADRLPRARRLDRQEPASHCTIALRQLSESFGVKRIDGILGTTLFYHFLATLDYPQGELVLRRKDAKSLQQFAAESSARNVAVPFWMASDHFMVGWGRVETLPPTLLVVDTGLAGAGAKLAEPVIKQAGIKLEEDKAYEGAGGGGKLKIVPYTVSRTSPSETSRNATCRASMTGRSRGKTVLASTWPAWSATISSSPMR